MVGYGMKAVLAAGNGANTPDPVADRASSVCRTPALKGRPDILIAIAERCMRLPAAVSPVDTGRDRASITSVGAKGRGGLGWVPCLPGWNGWLRVNKG